MSDNESRNGDGDSAYLGHLRNLYNRKQRRAGGWQSMGLDHTIFKGIERKGFKQPTPIQRKAIPPIVDGKDVVAMSRTGSGKTAAFVIPMLQKLKQRNLKGVRALIVEPTRELALQTFSVVKELGRFTGLRCAVLVGGDRIEDQFQTVHEKPDIIVAAPGRLLHVVMEMNLHLTSVEYVVFDEADRLFELGFAEQLHEVLNRLPENRQTTLFSATLPKSILDFSKAGLSDPLLVRLDVDEKISEKLSMVFLACRDDAKLAAYLHLVSETVSLKEQTIVFCATMKHVEYIAEVTKCAGIDCVVLYSQLDATARNINIQKFRDKKCYLLIVTDIAARGVDIPLLDVAINFHFPPKPKLFVHRVGRVARAGRCGRAISLLSSDELPYLLDLFLFLGRQLKFATVNSVFRNDDPLLGSLSQDIIDIGMEQIKSLHQSSDELNVLLRKAENAIKRYKSTRPQPSSESVRRVKEDLRAAFHEAAVHPLFSTSEESERLNLLRDLHNFRPNMTVFEVQSSSKALPAAIMKEKRRKHKVYLQKSSEAIHEGVAENGSHAVPEMISEDTLNATFKRIIRSSKFLSTDGQFKSKPRSRKRKADELLQEKKHFIAYEAPEANSEKGLAVDRSFNITAKSNEIEIFADNDLDMYKQNKRKKWDRKLKKFVGSGDDGSQKKIRTEDGSLIPSSYKSGRYERWHKKQKITYQNDEIDDGTTAAYNGTLSSKGNKSTFRSKTINKSRGKTKKNAPRNELKNYEQILKQRKRKEKVRSFQNQRQEQKRKSSWSGGR